MEINISKIKEISKKNKDENWEFASLLQSSTISSKIIDKMFRNLYKEITSEIDCTECANCCMELGPSLNMEEIQRIANSLGISIDYFKKKYILKIPLEEAEYMFNTSPCPFLINKRCSCYEYRPEACISYPHLRRKHITAKLERVIKNCSICPIVFNVYERLKDKVWHRDKQK